MKKDNISKLYGALKSKGYTDIGKDEDTFRDWLGKEGNVKTLYGVLSKKGYSDIGDEQQFADWVGVTPSAQAVEQPQYRMAEVASGGALPTLDGQVNPSGAQKFGKPGFVQDEATALFPMSGTSVAERLSSPLILDEDNNIRAVREAEEDARLDKTYPLGKMDTAEDVYKNYASRFTNTQRGIELDAELAKVQDELTKKYLKEFENSAEYKQYAGKKYRTQAEADEANKAINELFLAKYGDAINEGMKPYQKAYNEDLNRRYGAHMERDLNRINKKESGVRLQELTSSVDNELESIEDKIVSRTKAIRNDNWRPGMPSMRDDRVLSELRGQRAYLYGAKELIEDSQKIIQAAKDAKDGTAVGGVLRGVRDKAFDIDTWTMGLSDLVGGLRLKSVLEKAEKGENLTPAEEKLLDASVNNMAVNFYYRNDLGLGYQAGEITGQSIPFMLEFLVNPVSASGNAMAKRLLTYGLKRFGSAVNSKAIKAGTRLATDALAAGGVTATTGMGHVLSGGVERLNRNYEYGLDEEGNLNVVNTHNMGVGEAFAKSATSAFLERQSEMIFNAFRGAPSLFKGIETSLPGGVNTFMNYVSNSRLGELWRGIKNNATMNELAKRTQFHGLGEEYLEEVYNNFANIPLGEMTFEEATDLENNIVTFLGLAPTQVMFSAIGGIGYGVERYKARRDLERTFGKMTEEQKRKLIELQEMGKLSTNKDIAFFLAETIKDESLTPEQKRAEIEYAYNLAKQNAIDEVSNTDVEDTIESENVAIDAVTNLSTGEYIEVDRWVVDAETGVRVPQPGNIVGWIGEAPVFVPEGMENTEENRIVLKPNEWNPETIQRRPAEEVKAISEEMIREEAAQQAEQEAKYAPEVLNAQMQQGVPFDTPNAHIVPVAPMPEGNGWIVEEYALDTNNKVAKTPIVRELTNDEYRDMLQAQLNAEEAAQEQISTEEQAASPEVVEEVQPTEEVRPIVEGVANQPQATQPKQPTLEDVVASLPKTNKGEIDYKAMTPQQQYQYTSITESPEVALEDLQADIAAGQKEIEKVQEQLAKANGGQRAELRDKVRQLTAAQAELQSFYDSVTPKEDAASEEVVEEAPVSEKAEESTLEEKQPIVAEEQAGDTTENQRVEEQAEVDDNVTKTEGEASQGGSSEEVADKQARIAGIAESLVEKLGAFNGNTAAAYAEEFSSHFEWKNSVEALEDAKAFTTYLIDHHFEKGFTTGVVPFYDGVSRIARGENGTIDAKEESRRKPLRERAKEWEKKLGVKVNLIESVDDVTNREAAMTIRNGQIVTGWFEESTGEVCFYLPNLESESEVDSTCIHEVVAHKGLRGLLGDKFDAFCDEVWESMSVMDKAKFITYPGVNGNKRAAADEYIAHLAENIDVTDSAWSQFTELIKRFLKALGLEPKMTNADIANVIKKSYQRLAAGEGAASVVGDGTRFRKVYHGSGASFDRFDHRYMGTGEGNQAFGWGTYVTDVEGIGRKYAGLRADNSPIGAATMKWIEENPDYQTFITKGEGARRKRNVEGARAWLEEMKAKGKPADIIAAYEQDLADTERMISEEGYEETLKNMQDSLGRNLYSVDIPDESEGRYIDYDLPMSKQGDAHKVIGEGLRAMGWEHQDMDGRDVFTLNGEKIVLNPGQSGADLYEELSDALGSAKNASKFLSDIGFTGIVYPANYFSGGTEGNAKNYVIFNEKDLKIMEHTRFRAVTDNRGRDVGARSSDANILKAIERIEENVGEVDAEKGDVRFAVRDVLKGEERAHAIKDLMAVTGRSKRTVEKWMKAEESLASVILNEDNVGILDMEADESVPSIWKNSDYPQGTVEFSNICKKRLPFTTIYQRLQKEFPDTLFDAQTLNTIRNTMKEMGEDVACALCFVEDRRQLLGEIGQGFIDAVKGMDVEVNDNQKVALDKLRESGDKYVPNLFDIITLDGMKELRKKHPAVAQAFIEYNNARGMQSGRLFQAYSAYNREILKYNKKKVESINNNGGLRIFSFSDFEAHHLIDLVQVLTDCAAKGIKVQGYTKVPEFAKAVKDTNAKINRSLIPKGVGYVDADYVPKEGEAVSPNVINGKRLLFDTIEGIDVNNPNFFDSTGSKSVGNILVAINDEHARLAMADPFVDYIIGFHTGQSKAILKGKGIDTWVNYKNEQLDKEVVTDEKGNQKLKNAPHHGLNIYTDVLNVAEAEGNPIKTAKQFTERFLEECAKRGYVPRFSRFLNRAKDGRFLYTPGYHKFLIDFKLFDKNGRILPQEAIVPKFDNAFNKQILDDYVKGVKEEMPNDAVYEAVKDAIGLGEGVKPEGNTRFRVANKNQEIFVSNAQKAVEGIKQEKGTPQQWLAMIEKNGGLKAGEDKWLGLSDWLKGLDKKSVTKDEILDFIGENKIQIEEVKYADREESDGDFESLIADYKGVNFRDSFFDAFGVDFDETYISNEQEAVDLYNKENGANMSLDEYGYLEERDEEVLIEWAQSVISEATEASGVNPINSTRLEYTTKGLENKAEIALTVPAIEPWNEDDEIHFGDAGEGRAIAWIRFGETSAPQTDLEKSAREADDALTAYQNELAEKYMEDGGSGDPTEYLDMMNEEEVKRMRELSGKMFEAREKSDANQARVLVIDEIQSKRHQEGREKGYKDDFKAQLDSAEKEWLKADKAVMDKAKEIAESLGMKRMDVYKDITSSAVYRGRQKEFNDKRLEEIYGQQLTEEFQNLSENKSEIARTIDRIKVKLYESIPSAPFEKNWSELAFKRMLRYAAENGFDKVAWTTGAQQAERYNLGKVIDSVSISKSKKEDGKYHITSWDKYTLPIGIASGNKTPEELKELFGKEIAQALIDGVENLEEGSDTFVLEGADLEVGGEGMKGFYDKMLPSFVNKYVKKWGTKVQDIELPHVEQAGRIMHSVDVTDAMKESVMEGQTMFRVVKDPAVDYISQAESVVRVSKDMEFFTMDNVANKLFQNSGRFMRELYKHGTLGRVLKGEYAEIDQIKAKKEYDYAKPILDEYLAQLVWMKHHATEAAQEVINDVISDVEYAMQYYKDLSLGKDVWRTKVSPRFRISNHSKRVKAEVDKFTSKYASKDVLFFHGEMTDEEVAAVAPGYTANDIITYINNAVAGGYSDVLDKISIFADNNAPVDIEDSLFHENLHALLIDNQDLVNAFAEKSLGRFPKNIERLQERGYNDKDIPEEILVRLTAKAMVYGIFDDVIGSIPEAEFERLKELLIRFGYDYREEIKSRTLGESRRGTPTLLGGEEIHDTRGSERILFSDGGKQGERRKRKERLGKLFDQVADMGLDGVLGNKEYTTAMVDIFKAMPEGVRSDIADRALMYYGGSVAPAVSDYLNKQAKADLWDKVVAIVREALRKVGINLDLNGNEVKYILWRSQKKLDRNNLLEVAEDIDMKYRLKVGEYDGSPTPDGSGSRFRVTPKMDAEYMEAVNSGDMEKAQKMVFEAAKMAMPNTKVVDENGYPKVVYHGTDLTRVNNGQPFYEFYNDSHFGTYEQAEEMARYGREGDVRKIYNVFINVENGKEENDMPEDWVKTPSEYWDPIVKKAKEEGYDGIVYKNEYEDYTSGDNSYIVFSPSQIKSADAVTYDDNGNVIPLSERFNPEKKDVRFRVGGKLNVRDEYEATIKKGGYQAREAVQDAMLSLRRFQELIEKASGKKIRDFENAWMHENRLSSVVQAKIHEMERKFYKPMMEAVKKLMKAAKLEQEQVADYLMLKHGIERNREMAVRKALTDSDGKIDRTQLEQWYQEKEAIRNDASLDTWRKKQEAMDNLALMYGADMSRDYSGLTSMFDTDDIEECTNRAYDEVEALEAAHPAETEALGKAIKAMTQNTLDESFGSGLMDRKVYEELSKDMYDYYIPLRGFEETTSDEVYAYLDQDRGAFNAPLKRAKGRSSKSDNPIAYLKSIAESGLMQGERNKMKQSFLNLVINHPSDLVSVREGVWAVFNPATGEWEAAVPPTIPNNATPADIESIMEAWEQQMEQAAQNDPTLVKKVAEAADVPYRVVGNKMNQHQVIVKRLGKSYTLTINGNPRLAMALNGLTNPNNTSNDGKVAAFVNNKIGSINRSLAAWYTTRNPDFVASNFMRDTFYTNTIVRAKEGNAYANKFHKNYAMALPQMLVLFGKYEKGTLNPANKTEAAFLDFMMNGGETGYSNLKDLEHIKKQIAKELKGSRLAKVEALAEKLDILNRAVENTARFAAFLTSREVGRSIAKSIYDAKEISVNFNKKGAGGTFFGMTGQTWFGDLAAAVGAGGRALYVFFNAAIQGSTNLMHVMKVNPMGTSAGLAAMFLMGAVVPFLFGGDDEKDYYDLPEHVRRNHLILPGTGDAWVSIPLPIEYRIMYGIGELLTSWRTGHERGTDIARKMLSMTGQALPLNFLEEGLEAFVPSAASPIYQVMTNSSWTGLPIYKENDFNKDDPEYTKAYSNVDRNLLKFTKALYEWTFDEENQEEGIDLNPAIIETLAKGYFGGLATQLSNLAKVGGMIAGEQEFDWRNIPIGNRLFKSGDERTKAKRVQNEYYENVERLDFLQSRERRLKKTIIGASVPEKDKFEAQKDWETMQGSETYKKYQQFKLYKKQADQLYKLMKANGSTEELEKRMMEAQEAANKAVR